MTPIIWPIIHFLQMNEAQKEAIQTTEGPLLMIAGPGTGKTFTLVKRISYLVRAKGVKLKEIMVVSFTEKAAKELLTRISNELVDLNLNINEMYIGTFHSVCLRLIKDYSSQAVGHTDYRMLDAFEQTYLVCRNINDYFAVLKDYRKYITEQNLWRQAQQICRYVNLLMEELVSINEMKTDTDGAVKFLGKLVQRYQEVLERNIVMDGVLIISGCPNSSMQYAKG